MNNKPYQETVEINWHGVNFICHGIVDPETPGDDWNPSWPMQFNLIRAVICGQPEADVETFLDAMASAQLLPSGRAVKVDQWRSLEKACTKQLRSQR